MTRSSPLLLALVLGLVCMLATTPRVAAEDDAPTYPDGRSTQQIEGLKVELGVPEGLSPEAPASLVVILHGAGGTAMGMAAALREWIPQGYVVCAPKSGGQVWTPGDVEKVKKIIQHLQGVLPIDKTRLHVVGFSNGGWSLPPLAFDDDLQPRTATWVASGYRGGKPPKWAAGMGVLAMAGTRDANASSARETVALLAKHVATVEVRLQPDLGHEWPRELMPYFRWWMGAREGRFVPGEDMNFDWSDDLEASLKAASAEKKGAVFVYAYDGDDTGNAVAKQLQTEVFMGGLARHYGVQSHPTKLDARQHRAALEALGITSYPAVVMLKGDGKPTKVLQGKTLTPRKVLSALRASARDRKKPDGY